MKMLRQENIRYSYQIENSSWFSCKALKLHPEVFSHSLRASKSSRTWHAPVNDRCRTFDLIEDNSLASLLESLLWEVPILQRKCLQEQWRFAQHQVRIAQPLEVIVFWMLMSCVTRTEIMISKIQCDKDCGVPERTSFFPPFLHKFMTHVHKPEDVCPSTFMQQHRKHWCHILGLGVLSLLSSSLGPDSPTF